jgi:hypothetical protein
MYKHLAFAGPYDQTKSKITQWNYGMQITIGILQLPRFLLYTILKISTRAHSRPDMWQH